MPDRTTKKIEYVRHTLSNRFGITLYRQSRSPKQPTPGQGARKFGVKHLFSAVWLFALLITSCEHRDLSEDDGCTPQIPVKVEIIWSAEDQIPSRQEGMRIHLFDVFQGYQLFDRDPHGGVVLLPQGSQWHPMAYDYQRVENLEFLNEDDPDRFEIVSTFAYSPSYRSIQDLPPEQEPTVQEASPQRFYIRRNEEVFTVTPPTSGDTLRLQISPRNVLREFTFLIYDVEGVENIGTVGGAISGMSASYFPFKGKLSPSPSTVFFSRVTAIEDGRWHGWEWLHNPHTINNIPIYPEWFPAGWGSPTNGWNGGWLIGAFSVFGPADMDIPHHVLTIEAQSKGNQHYSGNWGYWKGNWEENVRTQIAGAMAGGMEWRKQNGGFDIVLNNDGRLVIPIDMGLVTDVPEWDNVTVPLNW